MTTKSETKISVGEAEAARREQKLLDTITLFCKKWAPEDRMEAAEFNAHLHYLIDTIYTRHQAATQDMITTVLLQHMQPMYIMGQKL